MEAAFDTLDEALAALRLRLIKHALNETDANVAFVSDMTQLWGVAESSVFRHNGRWTACGPPPTPQRTHGSRGPAARDRLASEPYHDRPRRGVVVCSGGLP